MYRFPIKPPMLPEMAHFHKTCGVYSNISLQLFQLDANILNRKASLKVRFSGTILVQGNNIKVKNEVLGLKTPIRALCEIYRLSKRLMRWSDLNVFGKYRFRISGCSMNVIVLEQFWSDGETLG